MCFGRWCRHTPPRAAPASMLLLAGLRCATPASRRRRHRPAPTLTPGPPLFRLNPPSEHVGGRAELCQARLGGGALPRIGPVARARRRRTTSSLPRRASTPACRRCLTDQAELCRARHGPGLCPGSARWRRRGGGRHPPFLVGPPPRHAGGVSPIGPGPVGPCASICWPGRRVIRFPQCMKWF
jgi:hypothetical protein